MRVFVLLIALFLGPFIWTHAQSDFVQGRILDAENLEPVVFATIRIKGKALGVISNLDGGFKIPSSFKTQGDTLEISSMGYVLRPIALSDMIDDIINIIGITPKVVDLDEVIVKAKRKRKNIVEHLTANQIVRRAIGNLPKNLPPNPYSYVGYYRDYQLKEGDYVNLNEAILKVFDEGRYVDDYETSNIKIFDYKKNTDFLRDSIGELPYDYKGKSKIISGAFLNDYGGNEVTILRIQDPIRNRKINSFDFVNVFEKDFELVLS